MHVNSADRKECRLTNTLENETEWHQLVLPWFHQKQQNAQRKKTSVKTDDKIQATMPKLLTVVFKEQVSFKK